MIWKGRDLVALDFILRFSHCAYCMYCIFIFSLIFAHVTRESGITAFKHSFVYMAFPNSWRLLEYSYRIPPALEFKELTQKEAKTVWGYAGMRDQGFLEGGHTLSFGSPCCRFQGLQPPKPVCWRSSSLLRFCVTHRRLQGALPTAVDRAESF